MPIPPLERGQLVTLKSTGLTYTAQGGRGDKTFEVLLRFTGLTLDSCTAALDDILVVETPEPILVGAAGGPTQLKSGGPVMQIKPTDTPPPNGKVLYAWTKAGKEVCRPFFPEILRPYNPAPKAKADVPPYEIAAFMAKALIAAGRLSQATVVAQIEDRHGYPHVFLNSNGNLTISDDILKRFKRLCPKTTEWDQSKKEWRVAAP